MSRFRIGARIPAGPMKGGLPAFGGQVPRGDRNRAGQDLRPRNDKRSKKSYTGTIAGIGRPVSRGVGRGSSGSLPAGPRAHSFHSVQLPKRSGDRVHRDVEFHPAQTRPPSLMTRIRARLGRTAAAFGF